MDWHIRAANPAFVALLYENRVLTHPFVIGELALGHLPDRTLFLRSLQNLPRAVAASDAEVLHMIARQSLAGAGIDYVDAHLLASTRLTIGASFWTLDKRLSAVADYLGLPPELE